MKRLFQMLLIGAIATLPIAGFAAIENSHHDMATYNAAGTTQKCAFCHSKSVSGLQTPTAMGEVGDFCYLVCHDGGNLTVGTLPIPDAPGQINPLNMGVLTAGADGPTVLLDGHGMSKSAAGRWPSLVAPVDDVTDIASTFWPHSDEDPIQCTTCHSVHDSTNAPFLNAPLYTGDNTTAFCSRCHTGSTAIAAGDAGRYQAIETMGAHPTEFPIEHDGVSTASTGPTREGTGAKLNRAILYKAAGLDVLATPGDNITTADIDATLFGAADSAWKTGGHLIDPANGTPTSGAAAAINGAGFGCYSCHSAHQNATINGAPADTLLMGPISIGHVGGDSSVLCISCHGDEANNTAIWDAGVTGYGHPANEVAALPYEHDHANHDPADVHPNVPESGTFPLDVSATLATDITGITALVNIGQNGEILCITCHDVHGGVVNKMAIRFLDNPASGVTSASSAICNVCHGSGSSQAAVDASTMNAHHPSVLDTEFDTAAYPAGALPWGGGATLDDGLGCGDCHVFNGTAHNW